MNLEFVKHKTESITRILLAVAVLLGALTFLKIGSFVSSSKATMLAPQPEAGTMGANDLKKLLAETRASAEEIKKKNLFVPLRAKQFPVSEVKGILGHEVLIGERWYRVGEQVGEARVVAVEPTKVRLVWEGQEREFSPIVASAETVARPGRPGMPAAKPGPGTGVKPVVIGAPPGPAGKKFAANVSEKPRHQMRDLSPDERQRLRDQARQRSGGKGR